MHHDKSQPKGLQPRLDWWEERLAAGIVRSIDPDQVHTEGRLPGRFPRAFDETQCAAFAELKGSIRERGTNAIPICVRLIPGDEDRYQLVYGERRWQACLQLQLPIQAVIRKFSDEEARMAQWLENEGGRRPSCRSDLLLSHCQAASRTRLSLTTGR